MTAVSSAVLLCFTLMSYTHTQLSFVVAFDFQEISIYLFMFTFYFYFIFLVCVCKWRCVCLCRAHRGQRASLKICSLLPPRGFWGFNSSPQASSAITLPVEPSCWPYFWCFWDRDSCSLGYVLAEGNLLDYPASTHSSPGIMDVCHHAWFIAVF